MADDAVVRIVLEGGDEGQPSGSPQSLPAPTQPVAAPPLPAPVSSTPPPPVPTAPPPPTASTATQAQSNLDIINDARDALVALGRTRAEADQLVAGLAASGKLFADVQDALTAALKGGGKPGQATLPGQAPTSTTFDPVW